MLIAGSAIKSVIKVKIQNFFIRFSGFYNAKIENLFYPAKLFFKKIRKKSKKEGCDPMITALP
jgi:hypothetical protein